jgi:hypothetical protein
MIAGDLGEVKLSLSIKTPSYLLSSNSRSCASLFYRVKETGRFWKLTQKKNANLWQLTLKVNPNLSEPFAV